MNDWTNIRSFYRGLDAAILEAGKAEWADDDPYIWEHVGRIKLTHIEGWFWSDIRALDVVLYPQYPVGRFFVDFGNPVAKVAIECDGAAWHLDKDKDAARDEALKAMGWTVYRFPGWECRTEQDPETGKSGSCYVRLRELAETHGIRRGH